MAKGDKEKMSQDLRKHVRRAIVGGMTPLITGAPGVGKSAFVRSMAADMGKPCYTVIASIREPQDFGFPVLSKEKMSVNGQEFSVVHLAPPRFAVEAAISGGIIFLDEITTVPPAVQAPLLQLVLDYVCGDLKLDRSQVAVVAACNPPELAVGGYPIEPPLANRFVHYNYPLDSREWAINFVSYWGSPPVIVWDGKRLPEEELSLSRGIVSSYITARPNVLLQVPSPERRGDAWPSPRTWDFVSRFLAVAKIETGKLDVSDVLPDIIAAIGEGAALEFASWLRDQDLPDPYEVIKDPASFKWPPLDRADKIATILTSCVSVVAANPQKDLWSMVWKAIDHVDKMGCAEAVVMAAHQMFAIYAKNPHLTIHIGVVKSMGRLKKWSEQR